MGIYVKKRNFAGLKILLICVLVITIVIIASYYFVFLENNKTNPDNDLNSSNTQLEKNINFIQEKDLSVYLKKEDMNEYLTNFEFDQSIKKFIEENPDLILNVLREYQLNQNKLEQEKINKKNISSIQNLNLQAHPMYLGDASGTKVIYEFVDYNCGYCEKYHQELINVMKEDTSVKIVIIQMPILGNFSKDLTTIALASSLQGKFETVHNYLYSSERKSNMEDILADLFLKGVDLKTLKKDMDSQEVKNFLSIHKSYVDEFKITGSPATIIGNQIIPGFIDQRKIIEILEKEFS